MWHKLCCWCQKMGNKIILKGLSVFVRDGFDVENGRNYGFIWSKNAG